MDTDTASDDALWAAHCSDGGASSGRLRLCD